MMSRIYGDQGCDTPGHDNYQAHMKDPDCERSMCLKCVNLHRCGQSDYDACPNCDGWGKTRTLKTDTIAFSLEGLFDDRPCMECKGSGKLGG